MPKRTSLTVDVTPDTTGMIRLARIIARHLTALADELEAPTGLITFPDEIDAETAADLRARWEAGDWHIGKPTEGDPHA